MCREIEDCPTEVLIHIFSFLKPKHLAKCREVCPRWKVTVDSLFTNDMFWRRHCEFDFTETFKTAYYKSKFELSWQKIYRSLSLWPKIKEATVLRDEFASAPCTRDEILSFQLLKRGDIGVHTRGGIVYYDLKTMRPSKKEILIGEYLRYVENDDYVVILSFMLDLFVENKNIKGRRYDPDTVFPSVKNYLLDHHLLYYTTLENETYVVELNKKTITSKLLAAMDDGVMCFGHKNNQLHILTFQRNIYSLVGDEMEFQCSLHTSRNILDLLKRYNFLDNLDWRVFFQWMFLLNRAVPEGSVRDVIIVKVYGDVVLVGTNAGVFRIYYAPYTHGEFDLFNMEPVKQFNFSERSDCPVLSDSPIIHIDVMEVEDGHIVLVAMPKNIAILNFNHNFKSSASRSRMTLEDVQKIKMIRLVDN